jgi:hypothetical protein
VEFVEDMSGYEIWKKKRRKSDHSLNSNSTFESAERDAQDLKKVLVPDASGALTLL